MLAAIRMVSLSCVMKKVVVTDSSGKLGKEIGKRLMQHRYEVLGMDLVPSETTDQQMDIRDRALMVLQHAIFQCKVLFKI